LAASASRRRFESRMALCHEQHDLALGIMRTLWRIAHLAAFLVTGLAGSSVDINVRPNGSPWDAVGSTLSVSSWEELRLRVESSGLGALGQHWWMADEDGMNVSSWDRLVAVPEDRRVFSVVPDGRPFQWGPRPLGTRFPVKIDGQEGVEMETVAHSPRVFLIHNLFTENEALWLIERAGNRTGENALKTSGIGFKTTGARNTGSTRTSMNAFDSDSPMAKTLIRRCFEVLRMPFAMSQADGLQILRYEEGQAYISHTDWFALDAASGYNFDSRTPAGSNRYATVFLYLLTPPDGGYTVFPKARIEEGLRDSDFISRGNDKERFDEAMKEAKAFYKPGAWEIELTEECFSKLAVKPVRLGAALFYHQEPMTGQLLPEAEHGACPIMAGTKWGANLWIWNRPRHLSSDTGRSSAPEAVHVTFTNSHEKPLDLSFTMDDGEVWTYFSTLQPGQKSSANSYENHGWRFTVTGSSEEVRRWWVPEGVQSAGFVSQLDAGKREL